MSDEDLYDSLFGATYSAYMERPRIGRLVARLVWGGDSSHYYASMASLGEVPAGGTVVDCPCGAGPALRALPRGSGLRYLAVDLSPAMLRRARRRAEARAVEGIEFIEADAANLPIDSDSADLFLSFWGLHCYTDPDGALREAARVLRPGGRLVGAALVRGAESLRQRMLIRPSTSGFGNVGSASEIEAWLRAAGFEPQISRSGPMLFFEAPAS